MRRLRAAPSKTINFFEYEEQTFTITIGAVTLAAAMPLASAAGPSTVPMQGTMAMPKVAYLAEYGQLEVTLPAAVPQLTPLLVSNPGDSFNPADPWYDSLDPSRQGQSFSRRYGFVMNSVTDQLPPGTEIWIRKLSSSPGLSAYRYAGSTSKAWEPIFGTAGTTNAMYWNGVMFHPAFTAPPGTSALSATFEAYLLDRATGAEVPESSSGPFVLNFANVGDGRPKLSLESRIAVFWPPDTTNYVLEATDTLPDGTWTRVTNETMVIDGQSAVLLAPGEARRFFRMRLAP